MRVVAPRAVSNHPRDRSTRCRRFLRFGILHIDWWRARESVVDFDGAMFSRLHEVFADVAAAAEARGGFSSQQGWVEGRMRLVTEHAPSRGDGSVEPESVVARRVEGEIGVAVDAKFVHRHPQSSRFCKVDR
jgi:hypothetical protein